MKSRWGYCALTADFLHYGHIIYLQKCKNNCEKLYVGVMCDACVEEYKGDRPIQSVYEREMIIRNLKMVSGTFIQNTFEFPDFILNLAAKKGKDFHIFDTYEHARRGATMMFDRTHGISSTLLKKVHNGNINNSKFAV